MSIPICCSLAGLVGLAAAAAARFPCTGAVAISEALGIAEGTVKNHASSVLSKLGVRDRTRAVLGADAQRRPCLAPSIVAGDHHHLLLFVPSYA